MSFLLAVPIFLSFFGSITLAAVFFYKDRLWRSETARLKTSEERLNLALNAANAGVFDWHIPTGDVYTSSALSQSLGYTPDEFPGIRMEKNPLIHPDDLEKTQRYMMTRLTKGHDGYTVEYRMRSKSGSWSWILAKGQVVARGLDGSPLRVVGTYTDITDRKRIEDAVRNSESKYRLLAENITDVIWTMDLKFRYIYISPSSDTLMGYDPNDFKDLSPDVARSADEYSRMLKTYNEMIESAYILPPEAVIKRQILTTFKKKDGTVIWAEQNVRLMRDRFGKPIEFVGVTRDVTDRKDAEDKIRYLSYHDELTGLYNRSYIENELDELSLMLPFSLIVGDANGLKLANDTFGHAIGDQLLKRIAAALKQAVGNSGVIARWGGDEFIIALPKTTINKATAICEGIRKACTEEASTYHVPLSIALGTATRMSAGVPTADVLKEAEERMYRNKLMEGKSARSAIIRSLRETLGERTHETEEHSWRMQQLVHDFGQRLSLTNNQIDDLMLLAVLHDIGKVGIPDSVLTKDGPLTDEEWVIMKSHPEIGYRIAMSTPELSHIANNILAHHERWDGTGYPQGLQANDIPINARIVAIIDSYDVMISGRPYKKAMTKVQALEELKRCSGTQFDPRLVDEFIEIMQR